MFLHNDMGFFSVVTELLANLLTDDLKIKIVRVCSYALKFYTNI